MIPLQFDYHRASSVDDAVSRLTSLGDEARVLAGGQSLIPFMRLRFAVPEALVDISELKELSFVRADVRAAQGRSADPAHRPRARPGRGREPAAVGGHGRADRRHPSSQPRHHRRRHRARRPGGGVRDAVPHARRRHRHHEAHHCCAGLLPRSLHHATGPRRGPGRGRLPCCKRLDTPTSSSDASCSTGPSLASPPRLIDGGARIGHGEHV